MLEKESGWVRKQLLPNEKFREKVNTKIGQYRTAERQHEKSAKLAWKTERDVDKEIEEQKKATEAFRQNVKMHKVLARREYGNFQESWKETRVAFRAVIKALLGNLS